MPSLERTKILIVDDRSENILSLEHLISSVAPELSILTALSGSAALELLIEHDFALCLFDVQMPEMSGFELASLMRSSERCRHIPIIFVTAALYEESTVFEGYEQGAVDFLYKPLVPAVVRSKVRVFVTLDQQRRRLEQQVQELETLRQEAEAAQEAKSCFLANMSHEMRTPLSAVLGYAELLSIKESEAGEQKEYLGIIMQQGRILLHLIDQLLDLSRIRGAKRRFKHRLRTDDPF